MRVIGVQLDIAWEDKQANFRKVRGLLDGGEIPRDSLIVLPEMFATGFSMNVEGIAEEKGGRTETFLADLARRHSSFVLAGVVTRQADGRGLNQAVLLGPDGAERARYSKNQPFTLGGETDHYAAGTDVTVVPCGGFQLAPFVCYDLRFPEIFRRAVRRGAQLYAVIANWPSPRVEHWTGLLKARAIENLATVIGVNRTGKDPQHEYPGGSIVVGPQGEVLADGGASEGLVTADLDVGVVTDWRDRFPALKDMKEKAP